MKNKIKALIDKYESWYLKHKELHETATNINDYEKYKQSALLLHDFKTELNKLLYEANNDIHD
jgi:competence CoiA-like predicted nuclease